MEGINALKDYLKSRGFKFTPQREAILNEFLKVETHISADGLYSILRQKDPTIGQATVFRTMKLLADAGIALPVEFQDRVIRYEHRLGHQHHDHLICTSCSAIVEFSNEEIEKLQQAVSENFGFLLTGHRMDLFGLCPKCRNGKPLTES